jgi:hypothetical protein
MLWTFFLFLLVLPTFWKSLEEVFDYSLLILRQYPKEEALIRKVGSIRVISHKILYFLHQVGFLHWLLILIGNTYEWTRVIIGNFNLTLLFDLEYIFLIFDVIVRLCKPPGNNLFNERVLVDVLRLRDVLPHHGHAAGYQKRSFFLFKWLLLSIWNLLGNTIVYFFLKFAFIWTYFLPMFIDIHKNLFDFDTLSFLSRSEHLPFLLELTPLVGIRLASLK